MQKKAKRLGSKRILCAGREFRELTVGPPLCAAGKGEREVVDENWSVGLVAVEKRAFFPDSFYFL